MKTILRLRTLSGFAGLAGASIAVTGAWLIFTVFFAVAALTPEVCARLRHRRFYLRGKTP